MHVEAKEKLDLLALCENTRIWKNRVLDSVGNVLELMTSFSGGGVAYVCALLACCDAQLRANNR